MLQYRQKIKNAEITKIIHRVCGLVDPRLIDHGFRVSYLVSKMLVPIGITDQRRQRDICFLALLHDIGAYKTEEIDRLVRFETEDVWEHSVYGYLFAKYFSPLKELAPAILYHHASWDSLKKESLTERNYIRIAQIIFLSDRADILMDAGYSIQEVAEQLIRLKGTQFDPELVDVFLSLNISPEQRISFRDDPDYLNIIDNVQFTKEEVDSFLRMIISTIDFRSRHTVTHTLTTASISYELSGLLHLNEIERSNIICGALLHDLGKIAIPEEILEFPGKLSPQAMKIMRTHVAVTGEILEGIVSEEVKKIAVRHHEKLDGSGYPEGLSGAYLTIPERIVAIADLVSALAGTRSYKKVFPKERIVDILEDMAGSGLIDAQISDCMIEHFDSIMEKTQIRCAPQVNAYEAIMKEYEEIMNTVS